MPEPALAGDEVVLDPLVVVRAEVAEEDSDEVDVLLLEDGAPGPLGLCVLEPQRQGAALLEGQDVVLRVEDGDLVEQGLCLLQGRDELGVEGHDIDRVRFYTRGSMNRDTIKEALSVVYEF